MAAVVKAKREIELSQLQTLVSDYRFDVFIVLVIGLNCAFMALQSPLEVIIQYHASYHAACFVHGFLNPFCVLETTGCARVSVKS
jgi:hypothetical protein